MGAVDEPAQHAALPFRVYGLEGQVKTQDEAISRLRETSARTSEAVAAQAVTLAKHEEQIIAGQGDVTALAAAVAAQAEKMGALGDRIAAAQAEQSEKIGTLSERLAASSTRQAWILVGATLTILGALVATIVTGSPT